MRGRPITYLPEELAWIEAHKDWPRRQLHKGFVAHFGRTDVTQQNLTSLCKRKGWLTGRTGQFVKGQETWNKGLHYMPKGCEKGWFKKGERTGFANRLYEPIGTEKVRGDGYLWRKVNDDLPLQARWKQIHLIRWEEVHGPIPEGHCLKCLDGDIQNTDPSNWDCIPRAMLPRLNGVYGRDYESAPAELKPTIMAVTKLEHAARQAKKGDA